LAPERPSFSEGLLPVSAKFLSGDFGYIDAQGDVKIPFQFLEAYRFSDGLARVAMSHRERLGWSPRKYGFIDHQGALRIPARFDSARDFSDGFAQVTIDKKVMYVDKSGAVITPVLSGAYDPDRYPLTESDFSEQLAAVADGPYAGYVDATGSWAIKPVYTRAGQFHEGLAAVAMNGEPGMFYIDRTGAKKFGPFDDANDFSEGLAFVAGRDNS